MLRAEFTRHRRLVVSVVVTYAGALIAGLITHRSNAVLYGWVIAGLIAIFVNVHLRVNLPSRLLWALALLGLLHLAGGLIPLDEKRILYDLPLFPFPLQVDRLVHAFGSAAVALVVWETLKPYLAAARPIPWFVVIVVGLAGMGVGAIEEVAEFATSSLAPTHVGGYSNTGWDLVFNLVGCTLAAIWVRHRGTVAMSTLADAGAVRESPPST
jgi:hypothetical protein